MTKLEEILSNHGNLPIAVFELNRWSNSGILEDGEVRAMARSIVEQCGIPPEHALAIVEKYVLRTAALKWANMVYENG